MKLYLAGIMTSNFDKAGRVYVKLDDAERRMRDSVEYFLESYHYIHRQSMVEKIRREGIKVFLDSGAFSAFSQGVTIDIDRYCDYIKTNRDIIDFASVLDSIGCHKGTWHNQAAIERNGVSVLPCFHYGEPMEVGQYYVDNYKHFTLGGLVPVSTPQMKIWLDRVWHTLFTNPDGTPKARIHGFGVTSLPMMMRYPWDSVDSSTWVQWAANGMILLPRSGKQIDISSQSSRKKIANQHIDSLPQLQRQALEDEIALEGVDPDRLRLNYYSRWAWNAWAFPEYVKLRGGGAKKFVPEVQELF
jgi:hypothetical protein